MLMQPRFLLLISLLAVGLAGCMADPPALPPPETPTVVAAPTNAVGKFLIAEAASHRGDYSLASRNFTALSSSNHARALRQALLAGDWAAAKDRAAKATSAAPEMAGWVQLVDRIAEEDYATALTLAKSRPSIEWAMLQPWLIAATQGVDPALAALKKLRTDHDTLGLAGLWFDLQAATISDWGELPAAGTKALDLLVAALGEPSLRVQVPLLQLLKKYGFATEAKLALTRLSQNNDEATTLRAWLTNPEAIPAQSPILSPRQGIAGILSDLAERELSRSAYENALIFANLALALDASFIQARLAAAEALGHKGQTALAVSLLATEPQGTIYFWLSQTAKARLLADADRKAEAIAVLTALVSDYPTPGTFERLADTQRLNNDYAAAVVSYTQGLTVATADYPSRWRLLFGRGAAYERLKNYPAADADLQASLALSPHQAYVLNYLGYSWVERQTKIDQALILLRQAVALQPNDPHILDSIGWAYFRLNQPATAVDYLEQAALGRPFDATILDHLGDVYAAVGRQREARYTWQRALTFATDAALIDSLNAKLQ